MKTIFLSCMAAMFLLSFAPPKIFVCLGGSAYAYHKTMECHGLRSCSRQVKKVTVKFATDSLKRKPCGYCYQRY